MRPLVVAGLVALGAIVPSRVAAQDITPPSHRRVQPFTTMPPHGSPPLARWRLVFTGKRKFRLSDRVYAEVRAPGARRYVPFKLVITF